MVFKTPLLLLLIPIVLILVVLRKRREEPPGLRFSSTGLTSGLQSTWKVRFWFMPFVLRLLALVLCLIALAGPRKVLEETQTITEGIDIMLAVDTSGSMAAEDFTLNGQRINRLEVVNNVVEEFVRSRQHDRIGLIAFAAYAYTVCPLTTDYNWIQGNLQRLRLGMIKDGTAIGSAIASATARLKDSTAKSRIIVLLTDGINNAGKVEPLEAARAAQAFGLKIYTIGAGTKGLAPFPVEDFFGRRMYESVPVEIDEGVLKEVANMTGGRYFRATDTESLRQIYKEIDQLEKSKIETTEFKRYKELFFIPLTAAIFLILLEAFLANTVFLRIP